MLKSIIIVGLGSFAGGVCRMLLSRVVQTSSGSAFPWGTLTVNLLGCLLMGFIFGLIDRHVSVSPSLRLFLTIGFCGGFTTFSTFIHEGLMQLSGGALLSFAAYAAASLILGLLCARLGHAASLIF